VNKIDVIGPLLCRVGLQGDVRAATVAA
jgi:hypothetical protein